MHRKGFVYVRAVAILSVVVLISMSLGLLVKSKKSPPLLVSAVETPLPTQPAGTFADNCRKILVTSDPDYPPISWQDRTDPSQIIGVAVELIEMAFDELGIPVESRYIGPWKRALADAANGKVDVVAGLYMTQERAGVFDYAFPPFMPDPTAIFVMKGTAFPFEQWDDLAGRVGGGRLGDSYGEQFDEFARDHLTIQEVATFEQLYKMAEAGRIQYVIYGLYPGLAQAEQLGVRDQLEYLPNFVASEEIYMAFSKQSPCRYYRELLEEKLQQYVDQKVPDALVEKYVRLWEEQANIETSP